MKYFVIAVRDRVAEVFGVPNFVVNLGSAIRGFSDEVNREAPDNQFYKHPDDFDLYELGSYDDSLGRFVMLDAPRSLILGKDARRK